MQKLLINLNVNNPITPADLSKIHIKIEGPSIAAITGRGPIWLYAYLTHCLHTTVALFVFDPRIGYICVASHNQNFQVGDVVADFTPDRTIDIKF